MLSQKEKSVRKKKEKKEHYINTICKTRIKC